MKTSRERRSVIMGLGIAVAMLLVAGAVGAHRPAMILLLVAGVAGTVLAVARLLPHAVTLSTTLATCISIYTVAFGGAVIAIFHHSALVGIAVGFLLPLAGFVAAVAWNRATIIDRLNHRHTEQRDRV